MLIIMTFKLSLTSMRDPAFLSFDV